MARQQVDFKDLDILDAARKLNLPLHPVQGGRQYLTHCWYCNDKSKRGKLAIHPAKGVYRCAKCGKAGNVYTMTRDLLGGKEKAIEFLSGEISYFPEIKRKIILKKIQEEENLAPIEIRDAVYNAFLSALPLYARHRDVLHRRGLIDEVIMKNNYKSTLRSDSTEGICRNLLKEGYPLKGIPGFYVKDGKWTCMTLPGYFVPVRDIKGRIQGMQIRVDENVLKRNPDLRKYLWLSSAGKPEGTTSGPPAHVAVPGKPVSSNIVYITEGPLKADIAAMFLEVPFIGIAGVSTYRQAVETAVKMGAKITPVLFDMDKIENEKVLEFQELLIQDLRKRKINAFAIDWNPQLGKGIDDVLLTHQEQFKEFIREKMNKQLPVHTKLSNWVSRFKKAI